VHRDGLTVYDLDFDRIDTTRHPYAWGLDDMFTVDTITFRHYQPSPKYCTPDGKCF